MRCGFCILFWSLSHIYVRWYCIEAMVKIILIKSPDEWATTKQTCRDGLVVYLSFSSHNIYIALLLCIEHCFMKVKFLHYIYIFVVLFSDGKIANRQTNNSSSSLIQRRSFSFIDKLSIECPYHLCNVDPWIIISLSKLKIKKVWAKDVTSMTNSPAIRMHITIQNWCKATNANLF